MNSEDERRERIAAIRQRLIDGGCECVDVGPCSEQIDSFADYCLPCQTGWLLQRMEEAADLQSAAPAANERRERIIERARQRVKNRGSGCGCAGEYHDSCRDYAMICDLLDLLAAASPQGSREPDAKAEDLRETFTRDAEALLRDADNR